MDWWAQLTRQSAWEGHCQTLVGILSTEAEALAGRTQLYWRCLLENMCVGQGRKAWVAWEERERDVVLTFHLLDYKEDTSFQTQGSGGLPGLSFTLGTVSHRGEKTTASSKWCGSCCAEETAFALSVKARRGLENTQEGEQERDARAWTYLEDETSLSSWHTATFTRDSWEQAVGCPALSLWSDSLLAGSTLLQEGRVSIHSSCCVPWGQCQGQVWTLTPPPPPDWGVLFIAISGSRHFQTSFGSRNVQTAFKFFIFSTRGT